MMEVYDKLRLRTNEQQMAAQFNAQQVAAPDIIVVVPAAAFGSVPAWQQLASNAARPSPAVNKALLLLRGSSVPRSACA